MGAWLRLRLGLQGCICMARAGSAGLQLGLEGWYLGWGWTCEAGAGAWVAGVGLRDCREELLDECPADGNKQH